LNVVDIETNTLHDAEGTHAAQHHVRRVVRSLSDIQITDVRIKVIQRCQVRGGKRTRIYRRDRLWYCLDISPSFLAVTMISVTLLSGSSPVEETLGAEGAWATAE